MNNECFNKCREFLEKLITANNTDSTKSTNESALNVYAKLIELKSIHDRRIERAVIEKEIRESESYYAHQTNIHNNDTDYEIARDRNRSNNYREEHETFRSLGQEERGNMLGRRR